MPKTPVLMTPDNPDGWKLEELLKQLVWELEDKNIRLSSKFEIAKLPYPAKHVIGNNQMIINRFQQALEYQQNTQEYLDSIGPDQGPTGKPRV